MSTIFNSLPLPLLLPRVDLRGQSYCCGVSIPANRQLIYSDFFTACGLRYNTNNNALFTALPNLQVRSTYDSAYVLIYNGGDSSAIGYSSYTNRRLLGPLSAISPKYQVGGDGYTRAVFMPVYNSANAWRYTAVSTTTYQRITVGGNNRDLYATTVPDLCDIDRQRIYAGAILQANTNLRDSPHNFLWGQIDSAYSFELVNVTSDGAEINKLHMLRMDNGGYLQPIGFAPRRPLRKPPVLIEEEKVEQLVSLNGHSYRTSYCPRRIYEIEIELDGSIYDGKKQYLSDPRIYWRKFVDAAEAGVTLYIDRAIPASFWRPRDAFVCADMPNMISGALLDASSVRISSTSGVDYAYDVTLQIADETGLQGAPL